MKATEWAARLKSTVTADVASLLEAFVAEVGETARKRGGSDLAVEGAVREQRSKWLSVCSLLPDYRPELFETMLAAYGPQYQQAEQRVRQKAARKKDQAQEEQVGPLPGRALAEQAKRYVPTAVRIGKDGRPAVVALEKDEDGKQGRA